MPNQARKARWSNLDLGSLTLNLRSIRLYFTVLRYHFNTFTFICLVIFCIAEALDYVIRLLDR